ncbi:MAG: bifunctional salicylyl-CoA 5-hydroxylase/oxidoreductase, partial [Alphaproteobacteria bacterium]|nr:bifunctional salicylyl-CoA 5-hydroxylase/oxidoreductase [Alphaproteobacteria bacterium]
MKISIVGGGPAGLYFGLLAKKAKPDHQIDIYERNQPDDTFGFGVVFSDETLSGFLDHDRDSHREIVGNFAYWDEIDVRTKGRVLRSGGHGFCGMSRRKLLQILQRHATAAGCELHFDYEIDDISRFADSDLILAADGINSFIR